MNKICVFCETWESGGIESFLTQVLTHMDRSGLEVDLVVTQMRESVFADPLKECGIHFVELSGKLRRPLLNFRRFRALLRERNYDVVHLNLYQGLSLYYAKIAQAEGVPVRIAHSHNSALRKSALRPLKLLLHRVGSRLFSASATELWACSGQAAEFLFSRGALGRKGYRFIPNGIDTARFRFEETQRLQLRRELGLEGKFVLGHVGRLCDQKNQSFLLEVFAALKRRREESALLLVGEGPLRAQLEEKARSLGLSDSVIFFGTAQNVQRLFWAMDVFAFPSLFEGLGIVAVEAQAAGLPTLCSERVPEEVQAAPLCTRMELSAGAQAWADRLLQLETDGDRASAYRAVEAAGYGIGRVAEEIGKAYGQDE